MYSGLDKNNSLGKQKTLPKYEVRKLRIRNVLIHRPPEILTIAGVVYNKKKNWLVFNKEPSRRMRGDSIIGLIIIGLICLEVTKM